MGYRNASSIAEIRIRHSQFVEWSLALRTFTNYQRSADALIDQVYGDVPSPPSIFGGNARPMRQHLADLHLNTFQLATYYQTNLTKKYIIE
jgi:hypothetical protein